jgi:hypothetical protein
MKELNRPENLIKAATYAQEAQNQINKAAAE